MGSFCIVQNSVTHLPYACEPNIASALYMLPGIFKVLCSINQDLYGLAYCFLRYEFLLTYEG